MYEYVTCEVPSSSPAINKKMPPPLAAGKQFEIAIIGGGITGITLAIALCKRNIRCTIYEQASAFGEIGAGVGSELPTWRLILFFTSYKL